MIKEILTDPRVTAALILCLVTLVVLLLNQATDFLQRKLSKDQTEAISTIADSFVYGISEGERIKDALKGGKTPDPNHPGRFNPLSKDDLNAKAKKIAVDQVMQLREKPALKKACKKMKLDLVKPVIEVLSDVVYQSTKSLKISPFSIIKGFLGGRRKRK